jgi:hypothetical protein
VEAAQKEESKEKDAEEGHWGEEGWSVVVVVAVVAVEVALAVVVAGSLAELLSH